MPIIQGTGSSNSQQPVFTKRAAEAREPQPQVQPERPVAAPPPVDRNPRPSFGGDGARRQWLPEQDTVATPRASDSLTQARLDVDTAVVELDEAIEQRNRLPDHLRPTDNPRVTAARGNLDTALAVEIEADYYSRPPHSGALNVASTRHVGGTIADRFAANPIQEAEVRASIDRIIIDGARRDVDAAAERLDAAIEERNRLPSHIQPHYQDAVTAGRASLERAVRAEIDAEHAAADASHSPLDSDDVTTHGDAIRARYADDPRLADEVGDAVDNVTSDTESTELDAELDAAADHVARAETPDDAYARVVEKYASLSPEARAAFAERPEVSAVLDEQVAQATSPLGEDFSTVEIFTYTTLLNLEELIRPGSDPELAAAILSRAQPALDEALADTRDLESGRYGQTLIHRESIDILGRLSDRVNGAGSADQIIGDLARIALHSDRFVFDAGLIPDTSAGEGIPLALEIIRQLENDDQVDPGIALDALLDDYAHYVDHSVSGAIQDYAQHTEELNYYVAAFPDDLPPELREVAVEEFLARQTDAWHEELAELEGVVADHGVRLLELREQIEALPADRKAQVDDFDERMAEIAGKDEFLISTSLAVNRHPEQLGDIDLESALTFVDGLGLGNKSAGLLQALANRHVQKYVGERIGNVDPTDPASVRAAEQAIDSLNNSVYADLWGVNPEELETALEALKKTLPDGGPVSLEEADLKAREFGDTLDGLDGFSERHPIGTAFRALGIVASLQGAASSTATAYTDPNFENVTKALLDDLGVARDAAQFADELGLVADDGFVAGFGSNKLFGKVLGVAGIAFTVVGLSRSAFGEDANLADSAIGTLNLTAGVLGVLGVGGPAGAAIALGALALQLGLNHYRKVDASNHYTGPAAADFFEHAGFTSEAAVSLADRSGDGHNAIEALLHYGAAHGLSTEESIAWVNELEASGDLDFVRDRFHYVLDDNDGNIDGFPATSEGDAQFIEGYVNSGHRQPISVATADFILNENDIALPA